MRADNSRNFQVQVVKNFQVVPFSLGGGTARRLWLEEELRVQGFAVGELSADTRSYACGLEVERSGC